MLRVRNTAAKIREIRALAAAASFGKILPAWHYKLAMLKKKKPAVVGRFPD